MAAAGQPYDIAVLDMCMPDLTAANWLGRSPPTPSCADRHDHADLDRSACRAASCTRPGSSVVDASRFARAELFDRLMRLMTPPAVDSRPAGWPRRRATYEGSLGPGPRGRGQRFEPAGRRRGRFDAGLPGRHRRQRRRRPWTPSAASYSAVLMDCHMPVMDGFEATRRSAPRGARTGTRPRRTHHRDDRCCDGRRSTALPGGGDGRLCRQAR